MRITYLGEKTTGVSYVAFELTSWYLVVVEESISIEGSVLSIIFIFEDDLRLTDFGKAHVAC